MRRGYTRLPPNATLRSVAPTLKEPVEFVRAALGNMTGLFGDCAIRLAYENDPERPDYRIEMLIYDDESGEVVIHRQSIAAISGKTHRELSTQERRIWCDASMLFAEVQELLGELRKVARHQ
jgi:hypothetical protein